MAFRFFPEDERVIELLVQMSQLVTTSVDLLAEHVSSSGDGSNDTLQSLLDTEDQCRDIYFSLMTTTRSSYVVPIPRQDVYILGQWILRSVQSLSSCAEVQQLYKVDRLDSTVSEHLTIIRLMSEMTTKAMSRLSSLADLDDYWFEMIRLSRQSERAHREHRVALLDHHKTGHALRRIDVAEHITEASHALGRVSDEVGRILVAES